MTRNLMGRNRKPIDAAVDLAVVISIRLDPSTLAAARTCAERERRPLSQWIRNLIEDAVKKKGRVTK
jgi:hypothetical protein